MMKTTTKLTDAAAPGVHMASARGRQVAHQMGDLMNTRIMPYADYTRRRVSTRVRHDGPRMMSRMRDDVAPRVNKAMRDDVAPKVAAAVGTAMVASAPLRREAMSRGRMAIGALRGEKVVVAKPRHRMRTFMIVLGIGAAAGGIAAWVRSMMAGPDEDPYPTPGPDAWATARASDTVHHDEEPQE